MRSVTLTIALCSLALMSAAVASCSLGYTSDGLEPSESGSDAGNNEADGGGDSGFDDAAPNNAVPCYELGTCEPTSCAEVLALDPGATDGEYQIFVGGNPISVICDMQNGGWTRVTHFESTGGCLGDWIPSTAEELPVCVVDAPCEGRAVSSLSLAPLAQYHEVRGYVLAYGGRSPDAFARRDPLTIDDYYVDGVSITYGSPRQHIWSFAAGLYRDVASNNSCPCQEGHAPPEFVGSDFFCDSGNPGEAGVYGEPWYLEDPLWDLGNCGRGSRWFEKHLPAPTSAPIEVRIMTDQCDDAIAVYEMELYVR